MQAARACAGVAAQPDLLQGALEFPFLVAVGVDDDVADLLRLGCGGGGTQRRAALAAASCRRCALARSASARSRRWRSNSAPVLSRRLRSSATSSATGWRVLRESSSAASMSGHSSSSSFGSSFGRTTRSKTGPPMRRAPPLRLGTERPELRRGGVRDGGADRAPEEEEVADEDALAPIRRGAHSRAGGRPSRGSFPTWMWSSTPSTVRPLHHLLRPTVLQRPCTGPLLPRSATSSSCPSIGRGRSPRHYSPVAF